jgi:gas vesicle protein
MTNEVKGLSKGLVVGIFAGAAFGAILTLLYAPKSGKKLRGDIKTRTRDLTEDAENYLLNAKKKAFQLFDDVKKKSESLVTDSEAGLESIMDESEQLLNDAKSIVDNSVHVGKGKLKKERERFKLAMKAGINAYQDEKKDR